MCRTPLSFCLLMLLKNDCSQTNSNIYKVCCNNLTYSIFHLAQLFYSPITYTRCCNIVPNLYMECSVKGCCILPHHRALAYSSTAQLALSSNHLYTAHRKMVVPNLLKITDGIWQRQEEKLKCWHAFHFSQ